MKKLLSILIIISLFPLPTFAVSAAEIEQAKQYIKTPAGQQMLKSPEGKKALEEIKGVAAEGEKEAKPVVAAEPQVQWSGIEQAFGKEISQYGYDVFQTAASTLTPAGDVPVGPDYIIGPGDSFNITLWGVAEGVFKVEVDRQGNVVLPKVGVVPVTGLTYGDLKPAIERELEKYYEKINVGISIAGLRTIRVFILGEVTQPGSYSISSLSTLFSALFAAGGPTKKGTLRNIELIHGDRVIARVDLYKFLLHGDRKQDHPLQSGDTIFVPMIGSMVGISGNVFRPAIYEIKGMADMTDLIDLAGGILPTGSLSRVQIERIINHEKKIVLDRNISHSSKTEKSGIPLKNMDFVNVFPIFSAIGNVVNLEGGVKYPGPYELKEDTHLKDIIPSPQVLTFSAYLPKAEIIRIDKDNLETKVISVSLQGLFSNDSSQNIKLEAGDRIVVSSELKDQETVEIAGEVKLPGVYVIQKDEKLSSVLERAGGFTQDAYLFGAIFTRKSAQEVQAKGKEKLYQDLELAALRKGRSLVASQASLAAEESEFGKTQKAFEIIRSQVVPGRVVIKLDDPEKLKGAKNDFELEAGDKLVVPKISKVINVIGEVFGSGSLLYEEGKTGSHYIDRMGGFTKYADQGAVSILRADGTTISREQGKNVLATVAYPGDSIIVPQKIEHVDWLSQLRDFTKFSYEIVLTYSMIRWILTQK